MGVLGSIFGFGDSLKRRLRDAVSNPSDYAEMTADQNQREWARNPDERSMGFFNPVPLGTMGNFALRKELSDALPNLSRRDFMKKSAGIAGGTAAMSIPGAKLLSKFAPEEKEIAAKAIPKEWASVEGGSYRYHSLKDYLDDVTAHADDAHADLFHSGYDPHSAAFKSNPEVVLDRAWIDANNMKSDMIRNRLLDDEKYYNEFKKYSKLKVGTRPATREESARELARQRMYDQFDPPGVHEGAAEDILQAEKDWMATEDKWTRNIKKQMDERLDEFSPQAKEEMKAFKDNLDFAKEVSGDTGTWADIYINNPSILEGGFF